MSRGRLFIRDFSARMRMVRRERGLHLLVGLVAAVLGAFVWARFFAWGREPLDSFDWPKETAYLDVLSAWVRGGPAPVYTDIRFQETRRFLANPEVPLTPQIVLLRWVEPVPYAIGNWCALAAVGVAGTLALCWQMRLGVVATAFLVLLLGWNGHLVAHVAVGHSMWSACFFVPWFLWALMGLLEATPGRTARARRAGVAWLRAGGPWPLRLALSLALAMAQGGFHLVTWLLAAVGLAAIVRPRAWIAIGKGMAWFGALTAYRAWPAVVAFAEMRRPANPGFPSLEVLYEALAVRLPHTSPLHDGVCWWEFDTYVGPVALALVVVFALVSLARGSRTDRTLFVAALAIGVASMGEVWRPIADLPLPLVNSERGPSRFFLVPLVLACAAAARGLDRTFGRFERGSARARWAFFAVSFAVFLVVARDLARHLEDWRLPHTETPHWSHAPAMVVAHPRDEYTAALAKGVATSAAAIGALLASIAARALRAVRAQSVAEHAAAHGAASVVVLEIQGVVQRPPP
jgi:hypothetical protein